MNLWSKAGWDYFNRLKRKQLYMSKESETIQRLEARNAELQGDLIKTREKLIQLLDKVTTINQQHSDSPFDTNSPDFDNLLDKQLDDWTIAKGIVSQVYWGRVVSIRLLSKDTIVIRQQSHHLLDGKTKDPRYKPINETLSKETFLLLLDAMKYAEEKFGLDRKAIVDKLTGGGEFRFKEAIVDI